MEPNLQSGKQEEHAPYFLKWKWWRPLYYLYFAGIVAAMIFLYAARQKNQVSETQPAVAAGNHPVVAANSSQASVGTSEISEPTQGSLAKKALAPAKNVEEAKEVKEAPKTTALPSSDAQFASLISPPASMIAKGKNLFMNDCVACHGANGEGDGPAAAALKPKPRNFHSAKGWINGRMASGMFKTLTDGIPGSPMPPFSSISIKDRLAIISYIRSFKGFPKETKADVETLSKMVGQPGNSAAGDD